MDKREYTKVIEQLAMNALCIEHEAVTCPDEPRLAIIDRLVKDHGGDGTADEHLGILSNTAFENAYFERHGSLWAMSAKEALRKMAVAALTRDVLELCTAVEADV